MMNWLLALLACTGGDNDPPPSTDTDTTATASASETDTEPPSYYGTVPDKSFACPEFAATNSDRNPRDRDDLIGNPTVMWFYPLAASAG